MCRTIVIQVLLVMCWLPSTVGVCMLIYYWKWGGGTVFCYLSACFYNVPSHGLTLSFILQMLCLSCCHTLWMFYFLSITPYPCSILAIKLISKQSRWIWSLLYPLETSCGWWNVLRSRGLGLYCSSGSTCLSVWCVRPQCWALHREG